MFLLACSVDGECPVVVGPLLDPATAPTSPVLRAPPTGSFKVRVIPTHDPTAESPLGARWDQGWHSLLDDWAT